MQAFLDAIQAGASGDDIGNIPVPESYRAAFVQRDEQTMWEGVASDDKDPGSRSTSARWPPPNWLPTRSTWR